MGGEICFQKGRERGPWFEISTMKDLIIHKERGGRDASFERGLLKSWSGYDGFECAKEALRECDGIAYRTNDKSKSWGLNS
uniref:Uncharacterized protein n=1 Tax=viral metagenome TaxID=1070528 RepID=A0A6M3IHN0_9ZZZZ